MEQKNRYYQQIMELNGMEELKQEVRKWEVLADNIGHFPLEQEILLPDYFWISGAGTGKSYVLRLLAQYLEARQIMDFSGNKKVIEFELGYCESSGPFSELTRLIECLSYEAGYRQYYRGILAVHITPWLSHMKEPHMNRFLEFLSENTKDWLIVLIADADVKEEERACRQLAYYLRYKTIHIALPKTGVLYQHLERRCMSYGISISKEAGKILTDAIEVMKSNPYFDGYNTINLMAQEMIYDLYSSKILEEKQITAEMLQESGSGDSFICHYMKPVCQRGEETE